MGQGALDGLPTGRNSPISVEPNSTTEVFAGKKRKRTIFASKLREGMTKEKT